MPRSERPTQPQLPNVSAIVTGLELKAPPVAVMAVAAALMWSVAWAAPVLDFALPASLVLSAAFVLAGAVSCLAGIVSFRRARTTVNPLKPESASALVVSGIYRYSRNPMYLGLALLLLGWALYLSNAAAFVLLPAFVLYMNRFQIRPEERMLLALFGRDYAAYRSAVRRWL